MPDKPAPDRRERFKHLKQKAERRWKYRLGMNYEDSQWLFNDIAALEGLLRRAHNQLATIGSEDPTLVENIEAAGVLEDGHATN